LSSLLSIAFAEIVTTSVRDRLIERWKDTELFFDKKGVKRVYYLSLEFLMGRSLTNALSNLQLDESFSR